MIDDEGFRAMRRAATLAHAVPLIRVRVRHEGQVLLDIARQHGHGAGVGEPPRSPERDGDGTLRLPPCAFRVAVGRAHQMRSDGRTMAFLGLPAGTSPQVDVGLPCGGEAWPGGIYQVLDGQRWLYLFATTLPVARCRLLLDTADGPAGAHPSASRSGPLGPVDGAMGVGFHGDEATEITLVHTELPLGAGEEAHSAARRQLECLLATLATEELLEELGVPT